MMRWLIPAVLAVLPAFDAWADDLTAVQNLPAGTVLSAADLGVMPSARTGLTVADAVGKQLRVAAYAGRPILAGQLIVPTLVARNQLVTLAFETPTLRIETEGRALGAGGAGEIIRVMNISSRATLSARINPDGSATVVQR